MYVKLEIKKMPSRKQPCIKLHVMCRKTVATDDVASSIAKSGTNCYLFTRGGGWNLLLEPVTSL
jgi:hypothetical protein